MADDSPALYTRTFWVACVIHFTGGMSFGMFLLFPLFIRHLGGDELTIGLVLGAGIAASVVLRPTVGALLDRLGRRRVLLWGTVVNAASLPPFLLLEAPGLALYALAVVHFVAGGALFAAYFTYASDLVPPTRRVEGIAIFGVAGMAPNGLGPALGELLIARAGFAGFFAVATGFALVSLALITTVSAASATPALTRAGPLERAGALWREMLRMVGHGGLGLILASTMLFGAGVGAAFYFVAPFTRDLGLARAGPFFAAYALSTIALRILGRRLPDRLGAGRVAPPSFAVFAVGLALLCALPAPGLLVAAGIACGAGHGSIFPVLNALTVGRTPLQFQGLAVSLYTAALDLGQTLGTPIGGAIARAAGYRVMFGTMAAASLAGLALMLRDHRRRAGVGGRAVVAGLLLLLAGPAAGRWPALPSGPLEDNSFLIEEAYNQEAGVVQHIVTGRWDRKSEDWEASVTQEWPVGSQRHQVSFTVPFAWADDPDEGRGVGDVLLNYRYQLTRDEGDHPALAPRLSLLLPTGSFEDRLGTGSAGVQVALPASKRLGDHLAAHLNAGVTIVPHARIPRDPPRSERLTSWSGGGSLVWMPADAINLLAELLASGDEELEPRGVADRTRLTFNPGARVGWNGPGGLQLVWGLAFPIGLTADTDDFGVFLYLSAEHGFTRQACEQRRW